MSAVKRVALSFSRYLEFATEPELAKRMGCTRPLWLRATLKELVDNSIDAAEEAGVDPVIAVTLGHYTLEVADNGPGMSPELVAQLCLRSERTSTREAFAAPDRGAMGNALQTLMALPFGSGRDEAVTVLRSRGVEHTITLNVNRLAGRIDVERTERPTPDLPGTTIILARPPQHSLDNGGLDEAADLLSDHAWLNPHVAISLNGDRCVWEPSAAVSKWTPGLPIPAQWYSLERFSHRILAEIRRDPKLTISQFLTGFRGLAGTRKRAEVAAIANLSYQPLAALLDGTSVDRHRAAWLLRAMQHASRAPKHTALGAIGRETFRDWATAVNHGSGGEGEPPFLTYHILDGVLSDGQVSHAIPYRWELGACHLPGANGRALLVGQNFSPSIVPDQTAAEVLGDLDIGFGESERVAVLLHRITPARQTLDYGKHRYGIGGAEVAAVVAALRKSAASWIKWRTAQLERRPRPLPSKPVEKWNFTTAAFAEMADAYAAASSDGAYPVLSQQVFYAARPGILRKLGRDELQPGERNRFCYTLLPRFMQENPELTAGWQVLYKPRGELIEPHTGRRIGLGTVEVAAYRRAWTNGADVGALGIEAPDWEAPTSGPSLRFGAVLVVEKGGIADLARTLEIDVRHDCAVVGNEGQNPEAELRLVDALGPTGTRIFVLTDFDRQGFTIADNLRAGTWRYRHTTGVEVVHIGLRLEQIEALGGLASQRPGGLEDEPIGKKTLEHTSDDRLRECGATEDEIEVLRTRRVELNALSTEQLVALIETALGEHGVEKVIPAAEGLVAAWRSAKAHVEVARAIEKANGKAARWRKAEAPADLEDRVRAILKNAPTAAWDEALRQIAEGAP